MKNKLVIGVFVLMIGIFTLMLALPADEASIIAENRPRSSMPSLNSENVFSGRFATDFESFIGDSVACRSFFTSLSKSMESSKGFVPKTGQIISANKDIGTGTTQKQTLLVADNAIMEMFIKNPEQEKIYAETMNYYARKLPENIKLYNMIIPTQLSFKDPIYKNLQDDQEKAINSIYEKIDESVTKVDVFNEIKQHSDEYLYFRTDHHWTQRGAYYGYCAFISAEGGEAVDINDFEVHSINGVLGYLHDKVNNASVITVPDTVEWFDINSDNHIKTQMHSIDEEGNPITYGDSMYDQSKAGYSFFFGGDHDIVEMTNTNNPNGKTLVVIRESYANALAPWLINNYKKVVLVDPRGYKGTFDEVLDEYSPDEVLISNYIFTTNFSDYCELLQDMYQ